jgi:hypothetical protein
MYENNGDNNQDCIQPAQQTPNHHDDFILWAKQYHPEN